VSQTLKRQKAHDVRGKTIKKKHANNAVLQKITKMLEILSDAAKLKRYNFF